MSQPCFFVTFGRGWRPAYRTASESHRVARAPLQHPRQLVMAMLGKRAAGVESVFVRISAPLDPQAELAGKKELLENLRELARKGRLTLVYSAHDEACNQAVVLRELLSH